MWGAFGLRLACRAMPALMAPIAADGESGARGALLAVCDAASFPIGLRSLEARRDPEVGKPRAG
jgi:hypothetical protein